MSNIIAQERLSPCRKSAHPEPNVWYLSTHQKWGNVDNGYPKIVQFLKKNGNQVLPKISQDLLDVAAFLYTADKLVIRRPWVRDLHFEIPVFEKDLWDNYQNLLVKTLSRLSGDNFTFEFKKKQSRQDEEIPLLSKQKSGKESSSERVEGGPIYHKDCVALFSGGLDSLAGLVKLREDQLKPFLVSHSPGPIGGVQRKLLKKYLDYREDQSITDNELLQCALGPRRYKPHNPVTHPKMENSQRMRSFLHLSLATVIARQLALLKELDLINIYIIDNGILSINLPLVPCRTGSRSTRSTDPLFLNLYQELVNNLYKFKFIVQNPFIFKTKSQIVNLLKDQGQEKLIKDTISCWAYPRGLGGLQPGAKNKESDESKASLPKTEITRGEGGLQPEAKNSDKLVTHCGYCLPCLIRRMAILSCGLEEYDASYARDIMAHFGEVQYQPGGPDYSKTEHFRDLLYFCTRISNIQVEMSKFAKQSKLDVKVFERTRFLMEYPELSLITGNVEMKGVNNPLQEVIDMYKQFSKEVLDTVQDNGDDSLKEWAF